MNNSFVIRSRITTINVLSNMKYAVHAVLILIFAKCNE